MAVYARRDAGVAGGETLAVHAGRVLGGLVDALPRRVLPHQLRVAVASRARRDDRLPGDPAAESFGDVVGAGFVRRGSIAGVAVRAAEAGVAMHVLLHVLAGVAGDAPVLCACGARAGEHRERDETNSPAAQGS